MESTLLAAPATMSLVGLSKSLSSSSGPLVLSFRRRFSANRASQIVLLSRLARGGDPSRFGSGSWGKSLKSGDLQPVRREVRSVSGSAASFAAGGGGNDGLSGNGGGGGGGGAAGGKENPSVITVAGEDASALSSDVIILDVGVSSLKISSFYILLSNFSKRNKLS